MTRDIFAPGEQFDAVLANPPYIPASDIAELDPELAFEPELALNGGGDGLTVLRAIAAIYPAHLRGGGFLALEFGFDQPEQVRALLESRGMTAELLHDYCGNDRVVIATGNDRVVIATGNARADIARLSDKQSPKG